MQVRLQLALLPVSPETAERAYAGHGVADDARSGSSPAMAAESVPVSRCNVAHKMMHTIIDASPKFKGESKGGLYGDTVEELDFHTGRLLDAIDRLGLREQWHTYRQRKLEQIASDWLEANHIPYK